MRNTAHWSVVIGLVPAEAEAETEEVQARRKLISVPGRAPLGISILGNQEGPRRWSIIPKKRSELSNAFGASTRLNDSRLPIDKEIFMRMLSYYEIRSETSRLGDASTKTNAAQLTTAAHRRKQ